MGVLVGTSVMSGAFGYSGYVRLWDVRSGRVVWETNEPGSGRSSRFGDSFADVSVDVNDMSMCKICSNSGDLGIADLRKLGDDPWVYLRDMNPSLRDTSGAGVSNSVVHCYNKQVFVGRDGGLEVWSRVAEKGGIVRLVKSRLGGIIWIKWRIRREGLLRRLKVVVSGFLLVGNVPKGLRYGKALFSQVQFWFRGCNTIIWRRFTHKASIERRILLEGPLAWALIVWRCSLVFSSVDKLVSVLIHLLPGVVFFTIRWWAPVYFEAMHPEGTAMRASWPYVGDKSFLWTWLFIVPLIAYSLWQALYFLIVDVLRRQRFLRDPEVMNSYRELSKKAQKANNMWWRLSGVLGDQNRLFMYILLQALFTVATMALTVPIFLSYELHLAFQFLKVSATVWNGGSFLLEVMPRQVVLKEKRKQKVTQPVQENYQQDPNHETTTEVNHGSETALSE